MNEWIEWKGGDMPVGGNDIVNVRYSSNSNPELTDDFPIYAKALRWRHDGSSGDIIAYRLHKEA